MKRTVDIEEKVKSLYPKWEQQAKKQLKQHFVQLALRQLETGNELYTNKEYVSNYKKPIDRIWNGIWKHATLQFFSKEERSIAIQQVFGEEAPSTKAQQQEKFIVLLKEKELYEEIRHTAIVKKLALPDIYRYISMPFSYYEKDLRKQWKKTLLAIVKQADLPEPELFGKRLEQLEQNYKKIGLHLLFLYSLNLGREAYIWERERQMITQEIQSYLKHNLRSHTKTCKICNKPLPPDYSYGICNTCYRKRSVYYHT
ncbi:MAG: hypothetical protein ACE3JP_06240 [Ectobacillus sp.]